MSAWQPAPATPVDLALRVTGYLRPLLTGVWVADKRPTEADAAASGRPYPLSVVTVRRDGGPCDGLFDRPRFGVNVWAPRRMDAFNLASQVTRLILGWPATLTPDAPVLTTCSYVPSLVPDDTPPHFYATDRKSVV